MSLPSGSQKWVLGVLGILALVLTSNLVWQYRKMKPDTGNAQNLTIAESRPREGKALTHAADGLSKYDPDIHFAELKNLDSRPLPDEDRDPFQFVGGVSAPIPQGAIPVEPAAPVAPPPPPLKAVGYNEMPGGKKEAMVTFNDDLSVVHEGDTVGSKFKILTINPTTVVVEDGDTHQKIDLPIPQ